MGCRRRPDADCWLHAPVYYMLSVRGHKYDLLLGLCCRNYFYLVTLSSVKVREQNFVFETTCHPAFLVGIVVGVLHFICQKRESREAHFYIVLHIK